MSKLLDTRYVPLDRTTVYLARICYRVALSIEEKQPATALKLMQASHAIGSHLHELTTPFTRKSPELNLQRAMRAARCVRAVVRRLQKYGHGAPDQVTAALEIAERLIDMLEQAPLPEVDS